MKEEEDSGSMVEKMKKTQSFQLGYQLDAIWKGNFEFVVDFGGLRAKPGLFA